MRRNILDESRDVEIEGLLISLGLRVPEDPGTYRQVKRKLRAVAALIRAAINEITKEVGEPKRDLDETWTEAR